MKKWQQPQKMIYGITLLFITLSGFGQMPIFKRYYIADIPGLGWLAKFYVTHLIHYAAAMVLIALVFYFLSDRLLKGQLLISFTRWGMFGFGALLGLLISGGFIVVKNLSGIYFNHTIIIVLDLVHMSFCMVLLGTSFYTFMTRKRWLKELIYPQ